MKRKGLYIFMILAAMSVASCKKSKIAPTEVPDVVTPVVVEDNNYAVVANTFEVTSQLEGAKFTWQNDSKKAVTIKIKYIEDGLTKEKVIDNNTDAAGTYTITIYALTNFTITVTNVGSRTTATKLLGILPLLKPEVKLSKTGWTATASSEINDPDEELNGAENIVDNVTKISGTSPGVPSFWQSDYNLDPIFPYPHWLIVDMKTAARITKVGLNAHTDPNQGFSGFKLEGSADGVSFTDIGGGQLTFNPASKIEQTFVVSTSTPVRYVKITLLVGSPYPCLANFEAYARQ
jgi:hypothetical protein